MCEGERKCLEHVERGGGGCIIVLQGNLSGTSQDAGGGEGRSGKMLGGLVIYLVWEVHMLLVTVEGMLSHITVIYAVGIHLHVCTLL